MAGLEFGGKVREPDVRRLFDMKDVILDQEWLNGAENFDLYYMYRDLFLSRSDHSRLLDFDLRYDITVIPPGMLGCEYVKTAGHYHPNPEGSNISYPALYEVLEGEALYLLQNKDASDVVVVHASIGDKVLVPPDYGHVTINCSNKRLKMSNFVARSFSSLYEPFRKMAGAAYYYTRDGYLKNGHYRSVPEVRHLAAPDSTHLGLLGLSKSREMYSLVREPEKLDYLVHPQDHLDLFGRFLMKWR